MTPYDEPQVVTFPVAGIRCAADFYWPRGDTGPVPCVVMAHGGSGTRRLGLPEYARRFTARGMAVLVFDYRHFGDSDGDPRQVIDIREQREDYRAAVAYARSLPGIDPERIALWGTSLSGGLVLAVAADDPAIAAVVAQAPVIDGWRRGRTLAQRLRRDVVELTLRFTVAAARDLARWWRGEPPYLVPVVDDPGRVAAFVEPRAKEVFTALGGEATGWRNAIAPRFVFALPRYRRGTAERLAMPLLMCLADHDLEASSRFAAKIAAKAPSAEVRHYPAGHFDVYLPPWFDRLCTDQAEFLQTHLCTDDHARTAPRAVSRMMSLRTGTGSPLVFLPGLEPHEHTPRGLRRWFETQQGKPLAKGREVWWVARHSDSTSPTTIAELACEHAEALRWWFDHPVDVVGVSTGGSIALQLAADHPDVVRRLVVVSAAHRLGTFGHDTERQTAKALRQRRPHRAGAAMTAILGARPVTRRILQALGWVLGPAIARPTDPGLVATIEAEDDFDLKARLSDITAPTLIVGGDQDACYGRELFEETAAGIPDARLILYPGRGHLGIDRGRVARDVLAFLSTETAVAPAGISRRRRARAWRFARPVLTGRLGEDAVDQVHRRLSGEYAILASAVPALRAPMSRMTLRLAVDSLALYRALPADLPRADRLALISGFVSRWMDGQFDTATARWVYAHRIPHLLLRRFWFTTANLLDEPGGWRFRFHHAEPGLFYGVDVTRCGIVRFLTDQSAPELAPLMCRGDYRITRYLPPGVTFDRTQVIAEGAPFCDFRYRTAHQDGAADRARTGG